MGTVNSTTYAQQAAAKIAIDAGVVSASVHSVTTEYEAAALAANEVINLFKLPKGAVVLDMIVDFDDLGTGTTLDVGDSAEVDRYIDGADTATAAGVVTLSEIGGRGYRIGTADKDDLVQAKNLGAAATGTIKVTCLYAL